MGGAPGNGGMGGYRSLIEVLAASDEPSIRLWIETGVRDLPQSSPQVGALKDAIRKSERVASLLAGRLSDGTVPLHPYLSKWLGAHWILVTLAELGYPAGDESLRPLLEQDLQWLFSADYLRRMGSIHDLPLMHASIDANAVWAALKLGLPDPRLDELTGRLLGAQWPDGGWNCDRDASGRASSFTESLIPMRALALHAVEMQDETSAVAAGRAAEVFLRRRLFRRLGNGRIVRPSFVQLHFPCYWHYDFLFGLTVMAEAGLISDSRCSDALDLLESKRLSDSGFPAEQRYYRSPTGGGSGRSLVGWGVTGRQSNPFVSAKALVVLHAAGRA